MRKVLVTGGGGFVGAALTKRLRGQGCHVTVLGRHRYPHLEALGVTCRVGDIGDRSVVHDSCDGVDTVFHVAAKAGIWGSWPSYRHTNVEGTANVLAACRAHGVSRLIYTSTPSVVFDRGDINGGDETLPYASRFLCHYARSKAVAERMVLAEHGDGLKTCAIRPHLIWGPDDPHLVPRLVERGKQGHLKIVGDGHNRVDISYIDNVVHAHLLAEKCLASSGICGGKAYFIGQERPVELWQWINDLFRHLQIAPVSQRVSRKTAYLAGLLLEAFHTVFCPAKEPKMTRFLAEQLSRSHFFSHARAERDFGYRPVVSLEEGQRRLLSWLHDHHVT